MRRKSKATMPVDIGALRRREVELAREWQELRDREFDQRVSRDRGLERLARRVEKKRLEVEEKELQFRLKQVERASRRGCCCPLILILFVAPPILALSGVIVAVV